MKEAKYYRNLKNTKVYYNSILDAIDDILEREVQKHASDPFMHGPVKCSRYLKDIETSDGSVEYLISTYHIVLDDIANMLKKKLRELGYFEIKIEFNKDENDKFSIYVEFDY